MANPTPENKKSITFQHQFTSVEEFNAKFSSYLSYGGLFLSSRKNRPLGTIFNLELKGPQGDDFICGVGQVVWSRDAEPGEEREPGMGIKFIRISPASAKHINQALVKVHKKGARSSEILALEENHLFTITSFQDLMGITGESEISLGLTLEDSKKSEEEEPEPLLELMEPTPMAKPAVKEAKDSSTLTGVSILKAEPRKEAPKPATSVFNKVAKTSKDILFAEVIKEKEPISKSRQIGILILSVLTIFFLIYSINWVTQENQKVERIRRLLREQTIRERLMAISANKRSQIPIEEMILKFTGTRFMIMTKAEKPIPLPPEKKTAPAPETEETAVQPETEVKVTSIASTTTTMLPEVLSDATRISEIKVGFGGQQTYIKLLADGKVPQYDVKTYAGKEPSLDVLIYNLSVDVEPDNIPIERNNIKSIQLSRQDKAFLVKIFFSTPTIPKYNVRNLQNGLSVDVNL